MGDVSLHANRGYKSAHKLSQLVLEKALQIGIDGKCKVIGDLRAPTLSNWLKGTLPGTSGAVHLKEGHQKKRKSTFLYI